MEEQTNQAIGTNKEDSNDNNIKSENDKNRSGVSGISTNRLP